MWTWLSNLNMIGSEVFCNKPVPLNAGNLKPAGLEVYKRVDQKNGPKRPPE